MNRPGHTGIPPVLGGFCALLVAMGIGRFAYTALLPDMMSAYALDEASAGTMAAWNYAGYLAGVVAVRGEKPGRRRYSLFSAFLLIGIVATAGMGLVHTFPLWSALRILSGFASGICFVLCSAIVLDTLAALEKPVLAGFLYSGVGTGIALGGLAASPMKSAAGVSGAWIGMALICVVPAIVALALLRPGVNRIPPPAAGGKTIPAHEEKARRRAYAVLLVVYFLEGFGYIIGTTFLVALVRDVTNSSGLADWSWIIAGCAAAFSAPLWRMAARRNHAHILILAFLVQAVGMLLPVLSSAPSAVLASGLLLGGTFMGITVLALQHGVSLSPKPSAHTVAILTIVYGIGQILGPFAAGLGASGDGFRLPFILSAASLFLAAGLLFTEQMIREKRLLSKLQGE